MMSNERTRDGCCLLWTYVFCQPSQIYLRVYIPGEHRLLDIYTTRRDDVKVIESQFDTASPQTVMSWISEVVGLLLIHLVNQSKRINCHCCDTTSETGHETVEQENKGGMGGLYSRDASRPTEPQVLSRKTVREPRSSPVAISNAD